MRILLVCTGNICRSALAERLMTARLRDRLGDFAGEFEVTSAGTVGVRGARMDHRAAAELDRLGGISEGFASRLLTGSYITGADLVLTATRQHRSAVLAEAPEALHRTFTLREFADLAPYRAESAAASWRAVVTEAVRDAASRRGTVGLLDYDIADPVGQSTDVHHEVASDIAAAVETIVTGLADLRRPADRPS